MIGGHPIHEPQHPHILNLAQPVWVKHRAHFPEGQVAFVDHLNVADRILGIGAPQCHRHQTFAGGEVEPDLTSAGADVLGPSQQGDIALALVGQPVAAGRVAGIAGQIRQNKGLQLLHPFGNAQRPALIAQVALRAQGVKTHPTPLIRQMPDPGAGGFHHVDKRHLRGPV